MIIFFVILLASIASGAMGTFVVSKRISLISGSISHSILGGVGIALFVNYKFLTNIDPVFGAFIAAILASFFISWLHKKKQKEDVSIANIWIVGMGLGVLFISFVPGVKEDFLHFLFGDILKVSKMHIFLLLFLDVLIVVLSVIFYNKFFLICFDEEQAILKNINVDVIYFLLFMLISFSIVVLVQVVGIILSIALLVIPPSIARVFSQKFMNIVLISFFLCFLFLLFGTVLSFYFQFPSGATCSLIASFCYILILTFHKKFLKV